MEFSGVLVKHTFLNIFQIQFNATVFFWCPPSQLIINCMVAGYRWKFSTGVGYTDKIGQQVAARPVLVQLYILFFFFAGSCISCSCLIVIGQIHTGWATKDCDVLITSPWLSLAGLCIDF